MGGEDSRSDGEGEEGGSEPMMSRNGEVTTTAAGVGEPSWTTANASSSPVNSSTPTPNDSFSGGGAGGGGDDDS